MGLQISFGSTTFFIICAIIVGYLFMISFFGAYFSKFSSNIHDFFFSGQRFSWWLPFFSMLATGIGSYSYLKYSQQGFNTGMSSAIGYMNDLFIAPLFFFGWLPIIYLSRTKSVPEYFEKRFNKTARYLTVGILLCYIFYYIGYNLFTIGLAFDGIFGLSPIYTLPIIALFLGGYVTMGGQTAVIFTDLVQGLLLYFVGFLVFGYGLYVLGSMDDFFKFLPLDYRIPYPSFRSNPHFNSVGMFWGDAVAGSIAFVFLNQGFLMRYLSVKNLDQARWAGFGNLLISLPLSAIVVGSVGWLGRSIVTKQEALGQALTDQGLLQIENTFHTFVNVVFYVVQGNSIVLGLILAALLAALMSTTDTLINAASAIGIYDIYKPLVRSKASDKHYLKIARYASIGCTLIGLLLVIWFYKQKGTLMSIHYKGIMIIIPSLVTTLLMGITWTRFNSLAASVSLVVGVFFTFLTLFVPEILKPLRDFVFSSPAGDPIYLRALFGMLVTASVGIVITLFTKKSKNPEAEKYTIAGIDKLSWEFKGGEPNLEKSKKVKNLQVEFDNGLTKDQIMVSQKTASQMRARKSDIIYLSDQRWYLCGLRSGHFRLADLHSGDENMVKMSEETFKSSYLLPDQKIYSEKII